MCSLKIYVINLDRRDDRLSKISGQIVLNNLTFTRVKAVDHRNLNREAGSNTIIGQGYIANWMSHQVALKRIATADEEYGLILEDDADVVIGSINPKRLEDICSLMREGRIDLLQIGHISDFYKLPGLRGVVETVLNLLSGRMHWAPQVSGWLVLNSYRGGAHAYVVSKQMANRLLGFNIPTSLATDPFYAALATNSTQVLVGRLSRSWIEQVSRKEGRPLDSDVD